jgi:hypothetical protein
MAVLDSFCVLAKEGGKRGTRVCEIYPCSFLPKGAGCYGSRIDSNLTSLQYHILSGTRFDIEHFLPNWT